MKSARVLFCALAAIAVSAFTAACGGSEDPASTTTPLPTADTRPAPTVPAGHVAHIGMEDSFRIQLPPDWEQRELDAPVNQAITAWLSGETAELPSNVSSTIMSAGKPVSEGETDPSIRVGVTGPPPGSTLEDLLGALRAGDIASFANEELVDLRVIMVDGNLAILWDLVIRQMDFETGVQVERRELRMITLVNGVAWTIRCWVEAAPTPQDLDNCHTAARNFDVLR